MTSKRKLDEVDRKAKRQRCRKRSSSEPLLNDSESVEKRQALKRLFGRISSVDMERNNRESSPEDTAPEDDQLYDDENEDPLLDSVPTDMDPEQLGFLVCAQETLRFLHRRGIPPHHPVFVRLRTRLLQGIDEIALA